MIRGDLDGAAAAARRIPAAQGAALCELVACAKAMYPHDRERLDAMLTPEAQHLGALVEACPA